MRSWTTAEIERHRDRRAYLGVGGGGAENRVYTNFVRSVQVYPLLQTVICMQSNYRTI